MPAEQVDSEIQGSPEMFEEQNGIILGELRERTLWFVKLRWYVPPAIVICTLLAWLIGFEFAFFTVLLIAVLILFYNTLFYLKQVKLEEGFYDQRDYIYKLARWQVGCDYVSMFLLAHFTGGATSPLIFFFVFHIIFAAILLPPRSSYGFAALVVIGMIGMAIGECRGWIPHHALYDQTVPVHLYEQPLYMVAMLFSFSASVFIAAFSTSSIIAMLRKRIHRLIELSEAVKRLNGRLNALYAMTESIGSIKRIDPVLDIITSELTIVMGVAGISVKLVSDNGKFLRYTAASGLAADILKNKIVEVDKSSLNRQIMEGKSFVTGHVTQRELFQFGEELSNADVQSVLFVPLIVDNTVIGIMGAYCRNPEKFLPEDVEFFRQAAGLVAIAIENARSYEAIEKMIDERSRFMMRVAHNLRAPLAAIISMLEVVKGNYVGDLNEAQHEQIRRIDRRARTMITLINELMTLAENRNEKREMMHKPVDLKILAGRIKRTFEEEARRKGLMFRIDFPEDIQEIAGDPTMIEQLLENLVSNAIKYTDTGGKVGVEFSVGRENMVVIQISDNGIGIPKAAISSVFSEFFRAENARRMEEHGTGLGLAIVKEIIDRHGGRIQVESEEGLGTLFIVHLPIIDINDEKKN